MKEIVFTLDDNVEPSEGYFFIVTLSDGLESNEYRVFVIVERNTPPYFVNWSTEPLEFTEGTGIQMFVLPRITDDEDDEYSIVVKLEGAESFAIFD